MSLGKSNQKVKLFGVFSFKYDSNLVPDLIKNLEFCDGFVIHDDRSNKQKWYHEGETRKMLLEKARIAGADWVLCVDPDERFEISAGQEIRRLIELEGDAIYGFPFRELWIEDSYRVDGIWASKVKYVLFPLKEDQIFLNLPVHSPWAPTNENYEKILTEINLYHLKNIPQKNRQQRADLYNELDPLHEIQTIGYDYLADESGIVLKKLKTDENSILPTKVITTSFSFILNMTLRNIRAKIYKEETFHYLSRNHRKFILRDRLRESQSNYYSLKDN